MHSKDCILCHKLWLVFRYLRSLDFTLCHTILFMYNCLTHDSLFSCNVTINVNCLHYFAAGQAFVVFKTKDVAEKVVTKLEHGCLMFSNGRYGQFHFLNHTASGCQEMIELARSSLSLLISKNILLLSVNFMASNSAKRLELKEYIFALIISVYPVIYVLGGICSML